MQHCCCVKKGWHIKVIHLIACYCKNRLKINSKIQRSWNRGQRSKEKCGVQPSPPPLFTNQVLSVSFGKLLRLRCRYEPLSRGMVGGSERSSYRHALAQQSSQGSPGQIKHTRESRYYVESGSSIESNVNKSIECVAIRFIQHSVAKALKHHLDASDTEVSTCRNAVYWRTLKPCNLAVTVQKETLLDFHPAFIITMWAGYANQQY